MNIELLGFILKKVIYISLFILLLPFSCYADRKEGKKLIAQIQTYLKSGKDYDKAEDLCRKVLGMSEYKDNVDVHQLLVESLQKQYESKNMQLYLKTLKDTAGIFPVERRMFLAFEGLDSVEMKPDKKGRVKLKYRKRNSEYLCRYRPNLLGGSLFSMRHKDYREAWNCSDTYLECERQPLFSEMNLAEKDTMRYEAAYMAVIAARKLNRPDLATKYADIATWHSQKAQYVFVELYDNAMEVRDTVSAISYLRQGFDRFPEFGYFFPRLVDYYMTHGQLDTVRVMVDKALRVQPDNPLYRMALNTLQLNTGKYDECILLGDSLIRIDDKMATAYFNVGSAYYNKAILLDKMLETYRENGQMQKARKKIYEQNIFYGKSRPYLEKYRELRPKEVKKWAPLLYNIYFNLNMGREFEEIEQLLAK